MSGKIDFSTLIPDDIDLKTGDQGELIFVSNAVATEPAKTEPKVETETGPSLNGQAATAEGKTEALTTSQTDAAATVDAPAPQPVDWEKRYKDLQADYTRKTQKLSDVELKLAEVAGKVDALTSGSKERTPESDGLDSLDSLSNEGDGIEAKVEKIVTKTLEKVLGTGSADMIRSQSQFQRELDAVVSKYEDFKDYVPAIKQVLDKLPELHLNFEQAYLLTKKLASEGKASTPAKAEAAKAANTQVATQPAKTLSADEAAKLADKANGLKTEQGVAADSNQKRTVKSLRDCVAASWDEVGLAN